MIDQIPWIQRTFNFDFSIGLFPVIYSRLEGSIFRLEKLLTGAEDKKCSAKAGSSWSVKEQVGHLYDMEALWFKRLEDFKRGATILTAADMTNAKTNEANHNTYTITNLLEKFSAERRKMLSMIHDFDTELLGKVSLHPRLNKTIRVIDSLYFVTEHDDHHIAVISSVLRTST